MIRTLIEVQQSGCLIHSIASKSIQPFVFGPSIIDSQFPILDTGCKGFYPDGRLAVDAA
jgi:hypothetical protein